MLTLGTAYLISEWLVRIIMLLYVPQRRSPASARAWLLLIFFLPIPGLVLYALIGRAYLPRKRLEQQLKLIEMMQQLSERSGRMAPPPPPPPPEIIEASRLARKLGSFVVAAGNRVELIADYRQSIERLLEDIHAAHSSVHLLYYIFAEDATGQRAAEALEHAARRGVSCRVLLDSVGSRGTLRRVAPRLRAAGIEVVALLPVLLLRPGGLRLDLRNHRKIAVIDGRIGYIGSQNIVDPDANRGMINQELVARVEGPVVHQLQALIVADRYQEVGEELRDPKLFPGLLPSGVSAAQVLPSGPGHQEANTQHVLVNLIYAARRRVVLTTPYFVPDSPFLAAMHNAAERGLEVRLIVSRRSNKPVVQFAQQSYYEDLLAAGVRIHLYRGAFLHAKHVSIDDSVAVIGSSNLDIRSFALNSELSLLVYDPVVVADLNRIQERYLADGDEVTLDAWRRRSPVRRWLQNMCRLADTLI